MEKGRNYEDCVGKKYNKLTVKELFKIGRKKMFLCECECGNTIELSPIYILNGNNTSCGCVINKHGLWKHPLYKYYEIRMKRNGLERMSSCNTLELAVQIRNSWLEEYGKDNAYWTERTKNKIYKEDVYKWKKI